MLGQYCRSTHRVLLRVLTHAYSPADSLSPLSQGRAFDQDERCAAADARAAAAEARLRAADGSSVRSCSTPRSTLREYPLEYPVEYPQRVPRGVPRGVPVEYPVEYPACLLRHRAAIVHCIGRV